ncbi:hypothetical protein ISCGN_004346 [Ixodes scapularis]
MLHPNNISGSVPSTEDMETTQAHLTPIVAPVATPALPSKQPEITTLNFTGPPGFQVGNIKFGGGSPPSTEQLNQTSQLVRNALADLPQDLQIQALQSAIGERFYIQVRLKETPSKRLTEQSLDKKRKTQKRVTTLPGGHDKTTANVPLVQATVLDTSMEAYPTDKSTPDDAEPVQLDPDTNGEDWHTVTYKKKRRRKESLVPPDSLNTGGNPRARAKQPNRWEFEYKIRLTHSQTSIKPVLHLLQMQLTPISKDFTLHLIEKSNIISLRTNCKNVAEAVEHVTHFSLNSQQVSAQVFRTYGATYTKGVIYDIFPLEEDPKDEILNSDLESDKIRLVSARRLGKSNTAVLTFDGLKLPRSVLYGRRFMRVYPHKPKANALKTATISVNTDEDAPTPDLHLACLWAKRLQLLQRYRRGRKTPAARQAVTRATVVAKEYAKRLETTRWLDYSSSLSERTSIRQLWATSRALMGKKKSKTASQTLALQLGLTGPELANLAGDAFFPQPATQPVLKDPVYSPEIVVPNHGMDRPFSLGELNWAIHKSKTRSAPGPDNVTPATLRNLPDETRLQLLDWINAIWVSGELPQAWKHSIVVPIPKGNKARNTIKNFRPISLTSCVCKTMERMVLARLDWYLENSNAFHPAQTGFRTGLGAQDSLALISHHIIRTKGRRQNHACTFVAVDVSRAFDSVPHSSIMTAAVSLGISGRALNFIRSFLANRTFSVATGREAEQTQPKPNQLGVPQGSVLSPTLFNIVMAALPHALAEISDIGFTLYADDLTIWASHTCSLEKQEKVLQHALDVVEAHLFRVGLRASPEKTTYVCVASKKYRDAQVAERLHLVLAGRRISPSPSVRVLGIAIREDAAADSWLEETIETCNKALNVIRRICSSGGGASDTVAKRLYKALVVSRVCYGARHVWLSKAH